jgi:hypothetical protein
MHVFRYINLRKMEDIKNRILRKSFLFPFIGASLGVLAGYLYYHFIGCQNGTCAITSNPWLSMLWGAAVGYLLADMLTGKKKSKPENAG